MRVALTHPYSWVDVRRGAERVLRETGRALAARGHDVTIFTAGNHPGVADLDGVRVITHRQRSTRTRVHEHWFALVIAPSLVRGRFDVIHSLMPSDALVARGVARVTGATTVYQDIAIPFSGPGRNPSDTSLRWRLVRGPGIYACMSQVALDSLRAGTGRDGAFLPGGVALADFPLDPAVQAGGGNRSPEPTVLFSGALDLRFKRLPALLAAMDRVLAVEPHARLALSGSGDPAPLLAEATPEVRARVDQLGVGSLDDLPGRYRAAWATVLPSVAESFGLVLLESLASGTPIVVSDRGASQELVRPGAGVVTRADDVADLARGILAAFDLTRQPATAARCRAVATEYDWTTGIGPRLEALYRA